LAGREDELEAIDSMLRDASHDNPTHLSLFGEPGNGKSSLLNGAADLARARGLLVATIALTPASVETEIDFYKALYDATLQGLLDGGHLSEHDELMRGWQLRTYAGAPVETLDSMRAAELEFGLLVSAKLNGRMVDHVPVNVVRRDLERLLAVPTDKVSQLVVCLDGAELVNTNSDLAPSLTQLSANAPFLTMITAAETAGALQHAAPRAWSQIEVGPYPSLQAVLDAIAKPITDVQGTESTKSPTPGTASDIATLTGSVPYEVNLVCHFIWDAIQQGELDEFELSPKVIERVVTELEEQGRHNASREIRTYSALSVADYEKLMELAPYEALTVRELALLRLMLDDYHDDDLRQAEANVRSELSELETRGVLKTEGQRFEITGGDDGRLYLRYAARRHTGADLEYGKTYTSAAAVGFARQIGKALVGESYEKDWLFRGRVPQEVGDAGAGAWLESVGVAAGAGNIATLSREFGLWLAHARAVKEAEHDFLLFAAHLQVGVYDVEQVDLIANSVDCALESLVSTATHWIDDKQELLEKYDVRVVGWRCYEISAETVRAAAAYEQLRLACGASYSLFRKGARETADQLLAAVLHLTDELIGSEPTDPLLRAEIANALSRHGFMALTARAWDTALDRIQRSRTMSLTEEWLLDYNEAYVRASEGKLELATSLAASAVSRYQKAFDQVLLYGFFPAPAEWEADDEWNLIELRGKWIGRYLDLQLTVLKAAADPDRIPELRTAIGEIDGSAPVPILRLAGWATLTLLDERNAAAALFARAVGATRYDETDMPEREEAFARARAAD